jgi:plasmid stabilization system protein ParE
MAEVSFHPDARDDYTDAYAWYFTRSETAASDFETAFDTALQEIAHAPLRWHPVGKRHRTHLLKRFPYQIIYRVVGEAVVVIAVAHARRRPDYWKDRN